MIQPTIALCIPAFNEAENLPRLLQSAAAQTAPFAEILVYDDCSTDETAGVAARLGARVVRGHENRGCSYGKNRLAEEAKSDWVHFHDADDILLPSFVEVAREWARVPDGPDVVLFGYEYVDLATGENIATHSYERRGEVEDPVALAVGEVLCNFGLYRRFKFLRAGGFDLDPEVLYNEDAAMHIRLAVNGLRFALEPAITSINYKRAGSMSSANLAKCARALLAVMLKYSEALGKKYGDAMASRLWQIATLSATTLDWESTDLCLKSAGRLGSRTPRDANSRFRLLCAINPSLAYRAREYGVRLLKPRLRA